MLLHPDRFFDPHPDIRQLARALYEEIKDTPILSPHGHVEASWFADNQPFADPTELLLLPDHYLLRLLYSQGVSLESLGVQPKDDAPYQQDRKQAWRQFAKHYYLFDGTPSGAWFDYELSTLFGIEERLSEDNAEALYDQINEALQTPAFRPRALFDSFNVEVLSTTNGATDPLIHHQTLQDSEWNGRILPCLRPDDVLNLHHPQWKQNVETLSSLSGIDIHDYTTFIQALEERRDFFRKQGAVSTDHGVESVMTAQLSQQEVSVLFTRALKGEANEEDNHRFSGHMLIEMARMSVEDGMTMQIHPGSFRNHNKDVYRRFGPDKGSDIPLPMDYTRGLHALLNAFGNDHRFKLVLFTLDESTYSRELAPLAGHYPALHVGPAWWFHDSYQGMKRFRQMIWETASIYNTVGFIDDTRALLSVPARHDLARRMDCDFLARLVCTHIIDEQQARRMLTALTYDLTKKVYQL